jgi:hypothetical protein
MKPSRSHLSPGTRALLASFGLFGIVAAVLYPQLPARMVSHVDCFGRPDGYLSPATNLAILLVSSVVFVLVFGAMWYGVRRIDPATMHLPDTARWRDPVERTALRDRLADSLLWLAAASVAWMASMLHSLYRMNQPGASGMGGDFWLYLLLYFIFMLVWPLLQLAPLYDSDSAKK